MADILTLTLTLTLTQALHDAYPAVRVVTSAIDPVGPATLR